jgi:hypothetical protein
VSWRTFLARREDLLRTLSPPILSAVARRDTPSPIFHGCSDWHSAVHGVYALYAIYQRTGDELYLEAAEAQARPELVTAELEFMRSVVEEVENPYGYAWLLALAVREELATGARWLRPLADYAAGRIASLVSGLDAGTAHALVTTDRHRNLSFALIHLALWARHTGDGDLLDVAAAGARRWLLDPPVDAELPVAADAGETREFMAPGLMRLAAIGSVLGPGHVRGLLPARYVVPPLTEPATVHAAGVNFFRAFALLHLSRALGAARLRDNAARLVLYQAGRPDLWRSAGYDRRHWVAQIGVRVIDDSYENGA